MSGNHRRIPVHPLRPSSLSLSLDVYTLLQKPFRNFTMHFIAGNNCPGVFVSRPPRPPPIARGEHLEIHGAKYAWRITALEERPGVFSRGRFPYSVSDRSCFIWIFVHSHENRFIVTLVLSWIFGQSGDVKRRRLMGPFYRNVRRALNYQRALNN